MGDLKPGSFYWVIPANDPDAEEPWEAEAQPARYEGKTDHSREDVWYCLNIDGPTTWPMKWVGKEIVCDD